MKKLIVCVAFLGVIFVSCNSSKTQTVINDKKVDDAAIPVNGGSGMEDTNLEGAWELVSVIQGDSGRVAFNELYPEKKPTITFDSRAKQVSGTTSCNRYTGSYVIDGRTISFGTGMAMTKMACPGNGESLFIDRIYKTNTYFIKNQTTLMLLNGDVALLEFKKK